MQRNWKFHALAIGIICAIIVALYFAIGPSKVAAPGEPKVVGDRYIQIYTATWGLACNSYIDQINEQRKRHQLRPQDSSEQTEEEKNAPALLVPAATDNALMTVSKFCNGKLDCHFNATADDLASDPLPSCFKRLQIGYRCFTYDRLWTIEIAQGDPVSIDCHESGPTTVQ